MPFLSSKVRVDGMIAEATRRGCQVDEWWRDETRLAWPTGAVRDGLMPVAAGGCVAWLGHHEYANAHGWIVAALAPDEGHTLGVVVDPRTLVEADGRLPAHWITEAGVKARKRLARAPVHEGDLVGCVPGQRSAAYLGRAVTVQDGEAVQIELGSGAVVPARLVGRNWFALDGREAAAAWFWARGQVEWPTYLEMRADLRRMQRKLDPEGLKAHDAARKDRLRAEALAREIADLI